MSINLNLQRAARELTYHERIALDLIAQGRRCLEGRGVGDRTLQRLARGKLIKKKVRRNERAELTPRGQELHQALLSLGWVPPATYPIDSE